MRTKVATTDELKPGRCKTLELGGKMIAVWNVDGQYYALEDACSHMGIPLSTGFLSKTSITCEWHGAEFDLQTGEALCGPDRSAVKTYTVHINGTDVEVEH
jgi:3-phenylpropionate/trans-cinnamate dioxygenase ferredoxin subunit